MQWFEFNPGWPCLCFAVMILNMTPVLALRIWRPRNPAALQRAVTLPPMVGWERPAYWLVMAPFFGMYAYSVGVRFTTAPELLALGGLLYLAGLLLRTWAFVSYAQTPAGQLITAGPYRLSRNPGYFAATVALLGLGFMGGSWLMVAVAVYFFAGYQWVSRLEERFCIAHWPVDYPRYQQQVARNFVFF